MILTPEGRWPPVYDADDLARTIRDLVREGTFDARFWTLLDIGRVPIVCQGDVVKMASEVPLLDENGVPHATDPCDHWLVIGDTCDFDRDLKDCAFTQLVPLVDLGRELRAEALRDLRAYGQSRRFYIPPWPGGDDHHRVADFTRPVPIHKSAFPSPARVLARLQFPGWALLHSCLVRFLARGDGRFDE